MKSFMLHRWIGVWMVGLCALASPARAEIDPALVGLWLLQVPVTAFNQNVVSVFEFRDDGTYTFHDVASGHAGTYDAHDGQWSLAAQTTPWQDGGSYAFDGQDILRLTGVFGPSEWHRYDKPSFFATAMIGGQPIPLYVDMVVAQTWVEVALPWRADAIPVSPLDIERWDKNGQFKFRMHFLSPSTGAGLVVDLFKFQRDTFESDAVSWPSLAMPLTFVDLPQVIALSTQEGRAGPYKSFTFDDQNPGWGWAVWPEQANTATVDVFHITEDGQVSRTVNWDYIDWYNDAWEHALGPIRGAFGAAAGGGYAGDSFWRDMCQRQWAGAGGGSYDPGTASCF